MGNPKQANYNSITVTNVDDDEEAAKAFASKKTNHHDNTPSNEYVLNFAFFSFLGFLLVQTVFALIANSQSMLADSEAMSVDAITYLFNLLAERIKQTPSSSNHHKELRRLYLELIPPAISVSTLIFITILTFREAFDTLFYGKNENDDVSVVIMFTFSALNLLLDVVNVHCFAKINMNFGLDLVKKESYNIYESTRGTEVSHLLQDETRGGLVNLNMCSAWTHVCADTMRSIAVLVAAALAEVFSFIDGATADSVAAIVVSTIILISLIPLLQGLIITALQIRDLHKRGPPDR